MASSQALSKASATPGVSQSAVVDAALKQFFDVSDGPQAPLLRRLDQISRTSQLHARHIDLVLEALALFVQSYFTAVPPVLASEQAAQKALGAKRFEAFITELGRRVAGGASLASDMLGSVPENMRAQQSAANDAHVDRDDDLAEHPVQRETSHAA